MRLKKEIFKKIASIAFVLVLLMPITVQLAHAMEGHQHKICNNFSTHIHKTKLNCSICAFHFSIFNYTTENFLAFKKIESNHKTESNYLFPEITSSPLHYLLRGPPLFS